MSKAGSGNSKAMNEKMLREAQKKLALQLITKEQLRRR
jgi:hypothetical protein